ncbi:acyl-CoA dehydrogenase family protein [Streptomyces sp. NPDC048644]|uniref:acyl-CoA dehydrogenase family protein n=1 Tax=Streptomyces sp. NPDC048644 TaxID=3365582 RepID=UPI00371F40AD
MTFLLDDEQREFGRTLGRLLGAADTPAVVRAWAGGDTGPGRKLWQRLAGTGVFALAVPDEHGGTDFLPVELAVTFVELGRYAVPGPVVESVAAAVLLGHLDRPESAASWLPRIAAGSALVSYADAAHGPYALDADAADVTLAVAGDRLRRPAGHGVVQPSLDPARRLARPAGDGELLAHGPRVTAAAAAAADTAALLTAAQALGTGCRLLADTVDYVRQRTQFGVPVGSFQAVKHRLADALLALEFARPLVFAAAVALARAADGTASRDVAAAKAAAGEAAYGAARAALQLHGAVGYTEELDLSLWIRKARALRTAWGTPSQCRARVLAATQGGVPAAGDSFYW